MPAVTESRPGGTVATIKSYLTGSAAGLVARILSLVAGVGNLWLLTQILVKDQFAAYAFTLAVIVWLATLGTAGLEKTLLYRLSRASAEPGDLVGGPMVAAALIVTIPLSIMLGAGVVLTVSLTDFEPLPDFTFWISVFAPVLVLTCVGRIFEAWYWARGHIALSVLIPAIGEIARTLFLLVAFFAFPTAIGVATAVLLAALIPLIAWLVVVPLATLRHPERIARDDLRYGLKIMLSGATRDSTNQIDVLLIGLLATAAATADYVVAARLAVVVPLVKGTLGTILTPRIGRYLASENRAALSREYNQIRLLGLCAALLAASTLAVVGAPVIAFFGDFSHSYPLLMILVGGYIVGVGCGSNIAFLTMAGHAGWVLVTRLVLLVSIATLNLILIPAMGAAGAALGMSVGMVIVNLLICSLIWRLDRVATLSWPLVAGLGAAYALFLLVAFNALPGLLAALLMVAAAIGIMFMQSPIWLPKAKRFIRAYYE